MKRPRKKISSQKRALIQKFEGKGGRVKFTSDQAEDEPTTKQAPPDAAAQDFKHTLPTQGALHRRHK